MKTVIYASLLSVLSTASALGHSTGLAHAHPHAENASYLTAFLTISIVGGLSWLAFHKGRQTLSRARSRK